MKASELKEYLSGNHERISKVMEALGIHRIWETGDELRGAPPESDNHTAISVNVDTLFCSYYKSGEAFRGDIISLAELLRKESFKESIRFIGNLFGLSTSGFRKSNKVDPLQRFRDISKRSKPVTDLDEVEVAKFGMEPLRDFVMVPHVSLLYEGITPQTSEVFKVGYDPKMDRIIFPHFSYDDAGSIVGITGRTTRSAHEIEQFKIPKYWNYIKGYKKIYNIYGFSHSIKYVEENGMFVIFEAEKSVLKNWSQTRNRGFSGAVGGHEIAPTQAQIIMKHLPSDIEVVIAFDKDVMEMKDDDGNDTGEQFLINQAKKFSKYRKVSYVFDDKNLLDANSSPIDHGYKVWMKLLSERRYVE